jgi:hypothetical protein
MPKQFKLITPAYNGQGVKVDRNNCAVRALANVTGKDYTPIHEEMKKRGRPDGKGTPWRLCVDIYREFGLSVVGVFGSTKFAKSLSICYFRDAPKKPGITLSRFIEENPTGRFIVGIRGHNTTVINGKLVDSFAVKGSMSVLAAWELK